MHVCAPQACLTPEEVVSFHVDAGNWTWTLCNTNSPALEFKSYHIAIKTLASDLTVVECLSKCAVSPQSLKRGTYSSSGTLETCERCGAIREHGAYNYLHSYFLHCSKLFYSINTHQAPVFAIVQEKVSPVGGMCSLDKSRFTVLTIPSYPSHSWLLGTLFFFFNFLLPFWRFTFMWRFTLQHL